MFMVSSSSSSSSSYPYPRTRFLQVMWIRKRDLHVLTVGLFTYSTDARFSALHSEGSDTWTLRIASAQRTDSGAYECQVTIEPKMSQEFMLHIVGTYVCVCVCVFHPRCDPPRYCQPNTH